MPDRSPRGIIVANRIETPADSIAKSMGNTDRKFEVILVGCSAGGVEALSLLLSRISPEIHAPIAVVQHMSPSSDNLLLAHLNDATNLPVHEATDKVHMKNGHVYIAPPNYHLLVEKDRTLSLSLEGRVNFARPSIDVLFESGARAFGDSVIGIILTGANRDGSGGCRQIRQRGGIVLAQDPETAEHPTMPSAAIRSTVDRVGSLSDLAAEVNRLVEKPPARPASH